jgi:integrase
LTPETSTAPQPARNTGRPSACPTRAQRARPKRTTRSPWRQVRDKAGITGLVSHTLRKTVASFLDDPAVPTRKISDQLGHSRVSMTQDHYIGRKLTDRQTADVLEKLLGSDSA